MRATDFAGQSRKIFPVLFGVLLLHLCALAQELPAAKPESVGLSSDRLDRIANVVQHDIDDKRIAGAVTLVVRRGHVAWFKAQGMMDRDSGNQGNYDSGSAAAHLGIDLQLESRSRADV